MRYYDYSKARQLIEQFKPVSASLGMREDWSWTAHEIYEHGQFTVELFSGDIVKAATESIAELAAALKEVSDGAARLDLRSAIPKKYGHELNGLCGSCWATPSIRMEFGDGTERHFECFIQSGEQSEPYVRPVLGCLSGPCQDAIEDVPLEPTPPLTQPGGRAMSPGAFPKIHVSREPDSYERELGQLRADKAALTEEVSTLTGALAQLEQERDELRRDERRLDWLDKRNSYIMWTRPDNTMAQLLPPNHPDGDLREAIDYGMAAYAMQSAQSALGEGK